MTTTKKTTKAAALKRYTVHELAIGEVTPDPNQPRKSFDPAALQALADSIGERGILQPILVRQDGNRVLIVDGERRWRAAKLAKLKVVPVLLADLDEDDAQQVLVDQVSVNQLREELKPMELARVLRTMRDAGKTVNEIAATLSKQGHQAMTPAQISAMAALVDLPAWAHQMVDREEVEAKDIGKVLPIVGIKGVEKPLQKRLQQITGYRGGIDPGDVAREAKYVLGELFPSLTRTDSYLQNPVLFNWKTRCKGCEHLLQFEGGAFCRNEKLFAEHQAEAKAEGMLPGGKRPEKPKPTKGGAAGAEDQEEKKAEQRERSLIEKARDYLHGCLTVALVRAPDPGGHLQRALVVWRALKNPGSEGTHGSRAIDSPIPPRFVSLEQLTAGNEVGLADAMRAATLNIIDELPWRETHALARQVYPRLEDAWSPDAAFFELFRKAELVHLAVKHGCNPGEGRLWDRMKGDDIKEALLKEADKIARPQILVDLYEGEIEAPRQPYGSSAGWGDDDDDGQDDDDSDDIGEDDLEEAA